MALGESCFYGSNSETLTITQCASEKPHLAGREEALKKPQMVPIVILRSFELVNVLSATTGAIALLYLMIMDGLCIINAVISYISSH